MKKISILGGMALLVLSNMAVAKPLVLSSLRPLSLIVQEIGGNSVEVDTLLPVTASHHDYPLKASDYTRLQKADLVLWIGPELESFLAKPLANLPESHVITAYTLTDLHWPPADKVHGDHAHEHDPHLWLDPRNALLVAAAVTTKLSAIDPVNKATYSANMQAFTAKTTELDQKITEQMKPLASRGFAVYHEGFSHFVQHYKLQQLDYVTFTPEQKPGAKHNQQMRENLANKGQCLFLEPYNVSPSAQALAQELNLKLGTLDALGAEPTSSYSQLIQNMANAFSACLTIGSGERNR